MDHGKDSQDKNEEIVKRLYKDRRANTSYTGIAPIAKKAKLTKSQVENVLRQVESFSLNRPARRKYPTRIIRVYFRSFQWSCDLMDTSAWAVENKGYRFILVCVDQLSRY